MILPPNNQGENIPILITGGPDQQGRVWGSKIKTFKHPKKVFEILANPKNIISPILYLDLKKRP